MENKKKNLKKLSKENIGDVSGGWTAKYFYLQPDTVDKYDGNVETALEIFSDTGEFLGVVFNVNDAISLAKQHNCKDFDWENSRTGFFTDDFENALKKN